MISEISELSVNDLEVFEPVYYQLDIFGGATIVMEDSRFKSRLTFRLTESDKRQLLDIAHRKGISPSNLIRSAFNLTQPDTNSGDN